MATEHHATAGTCQAITKLGAEVVVVGVDRNGRLDVDALRCAVSARTALVSIIGANNETGVLSPIGEVVAAAHDVGAWVHCDATQMLGKVALSIRDLDLDLVSLSSHKAYGPKGIGALYVGRELRSKMTPLLTGGGQERGLRSGTVNTVGCVGFGEAAAIAHADLAGDSLRIQRLREALEAGLSAVAPEGTVVGAQAERLPNTVNFHFVGHDAEAILLATPQIAASTGSACSASSPEPSHVLRAMGLTYQEAGECVRMSLGRFSTENDIEVAVRAIAATLHGTPANVTS